MVQLWLKEGLTVFRDQEFTAIYARGVKALDDVQDLRLRAVSGTCRPLQHPPRPASDIESNN